MGTDHWRHKLYNIVDENNKGSLAARAFDGLIVVLIVANVLAIVLESYSQLRITYGALFRGFEYFSVAIFTIEYAIRLFTADLKYSGHNRGKAVAMFVVSPMAIIDLLAILPTYLPMVIAIDLRFIRVLRLLRLLRLFKLNRYSTSLQLMVEVFKEKRADLLVTMMVAIILVVVASILMYYVEGPVQPDVFPHIGAAFWWAITTITTVGYGDIIPVTAMGKVISGVIAFLGIGLVALPTGILSSAFMQKIAAQKQLSQKSHSCPTCGKPID